MAQTTIPARLSNRTLLEINGLVLLAHSSFYEVLTQDGKHRVSSGGNREKVVEDAVKWLEAKAVLTGRPMKGLQTAAQVWSEALHQESKRRSLLFKRMKERLKGI